MMKQKLAGMIDHTLLKSAVTPEMIIGLCAEAKSLGTASVCVNPCNVALARQELEGSEVKVCTVIGFPLGANTSKVKAFETKDAIINGAQEVDMVINLGAIKSGDYELVYRDIQSVVEAANGVLVKVIIETCFLTNAEKSEACRLAEKAGAQFVKTSTGFGSAGATTDDVKLIKEQVGTRMQVKASGGMRTYSDVIPILQAGADRLGVSATVNILAEVDS